MTAKKSQFYDYRTMNTEEISAKLKKIWMKSTIRDSKPNSN